METSVTQMKGTPCYYTRFQNTADVYKLLDSIFDSILKLGSDVISDDDEEKALVCIQSLILRNGGPHLSLKALFGGGDIRRQKAEFL